MTSGECLSYEARDGVAVITMNRPHARNALDSGLSTALVEALARAERDPRIAVIVLTGTDPAFCAGLDIKEFWDKGRVPVGASEAIRAAGALTKPAIGAINGPVMTGGLELALGLDFLIASQHARFADTHAKVGLLPGGGMSARLPRAVGERMARELSYTGRVVGAEEALRLGLVNRVVPHAELLPATLQVAGDIVSKDADIVRQLKRLYDVSVLTDAGAALAYEVSERDRRRAAAGDLVPRPLD
ncbi:enoyl-CoA hydratase [Nonomuraea wenchangensis]|uniref:enoyl-CoA hydratase n=1 Tax=Nonomuraea wenchangensis TaxID=568860 RepID=UPI0034452549